MEKILLIDNKKGRWSHIVSQFPDLVTCGDKLEDYFDFDKADNFCNPKFSESDYAFVFIHHSQNQDSMMSSAILELIKLELGLKLVLFSGGINLSFENKDVIGFNFRSLPRDQMEGSLKLFIKTSKNIGRWEIESLFFNYPKRLRSKISLFLDDMTVFEVFETQEMKDFLVATHIVIGSKQYTELLGCDPTTFLNKLETLSL